VSVPVIAFFNNKGGVGKTSIVYHLSWMYAERGLRVLAADLDPQANLTSAFLDEDRVETLFQDERNPETVVRCLQPLIEGSGDVADPKPEQITERLALIVGDMALSSFEDELSKVWPDCLEGKPRAFRVTSAFWRLLQKGAEDHGADVILIDLGPNLGAINRTALIASDFVVIPLGPDLFSIQGLRNLGPTIRRWREDWRKRIVAWQETASRGKSSVANGLPLPTGSIDPVGYVVLRHSIRLDRPVKAFDRWIAKMPGVYLESVLGQESTHAPPIDQDANCIAKLRDYRSLMPLAQEAHKPMFLLKPADGALGAHAHAVQDVFDDFLGVAREIANRTRLRAI